MTHCESTLLLREYLEHLCADEATTPCVRYTDWVASRRKRPTARSMVQALTRRDHDADEEGTSTQGPSAA